MSKIILISGSSFHSGKDTVGMLIQNILEEKGKKCLHMAFADWVKDSLVRYKNWDGKKDENGRHLMQSYATDCVRTKIPDYWARTTAELAKALEDQYDYFIITDLRFENEYLTCKKFFDEVVTVRVNRSLEDDFSAYRGHSSENSLNDFHFDYIVDNNGTLDDLFTKVEKICKTF